MFFNNLQKNQTAANVDQQSTVTTTPESTLCVELNDEELCAVNGGCVVAGVVVGVHVPHVSVVAGVVVGIGGCDH